MVLMMIGGMPTPPSGFNSNKKSQREETQIREQPKRKIITGFMIPEKLEDNTIYVKLTPNEDGSVLAQAYSNEDFNHSSPTYPKVTMIMKQADNTCLRENTLNTYLYSPESFLSMLKNYNNAEIIERYKEDGLILAAKLEETKQKVKNLEKEVLNI